MTTLQTRRLDPFGIEILNLDLKEELSEDTFSDLREAVIDEGIVVLRNQQIEPDSHIALGRRFGTLENLSPDPDEPNPGLVVIGNVDEQGQVLLNDSPFMKLISINEGWHTDSSFREVPASFSLFTAVIVPPDGGDTYYANLEKGWQALTDEERASLYGLEGVHDYAAAYRKRGNQTGGIVGYDNPPIRHPLVREHPETGRPGLYVSEHVAAIENLDEAESQPLLTRLLAATTDASRVYRHKWSVGDFIIWDNRSMLHKAQGFDGKHARVMHHVRVAGSEAPIAARP